MLADIQNGALHISRLNIQDIQLTSMVLFIQIIQILFQPIDIMFIFIAIQILVNVYKTLINFRHVFYVIAISPSPFITAHTDLLEQRDGLLSQCPHCALTPLSDIQPMLPFAFHCKYEQCKIYKKAFGIPKKKYRGNSRKLININEHRRIPIKLSFRYNR